MGEEITGFSMSSMESDIGFLRAALPILKDYLLSTEIYWSIGASPPPGEAAYLQLTLGGILLARSRLQARKGDQEKEEESSRLLMELEKIQLQRRVNWEHKAGREFGARLRLWRDFLEDYRSHPENHSDRYAYEVTRRVMLELLKPYSHNVSRAELELLQGLDELLRAVLVPGKFVWEAGLAPGFPESTYWYLYGHLRE